MEYEIPEENTRKECILDGNKEAKRLVDAIYNLTGIVIYATTENNVMDILHNPENVTSDKEQIQKLKDIRTIIEYEEA